MAMCRIKVKKRARILTRGELRRALQVATITRDPERNQFIIVASHALGLRVSELGRITPRDVMFSSGVFKTELTIRGVLAKNNVTRTVPMSNQVLLDYLEKYIAYRVRNKIGTMPPGVTAFKGLSPDLPLVFSGRGGGFAAITKTRVLESGEVEQYAAIDGLEQLFRYLYRLAGLRGASSHTGRRTYATRLMEAGVDIDTIAHLLGHGDVQFSYPYLTPSKSALRRAFESALSLD